MAYNMKGWSGYQSSPLRKEIPANIKKLTKTDYKQSKAKSTPNEKTNVVKDEHDVHAEWENPTGEWCNICGVHKDDHDASHAFRSKKE